MKPVEHIEKFRSRAEGPIENDEMITKLHKRIEELEEMNRDLMGMIENSFDGLAIVDSETRLLLLNPAFYKIMGFENIPCLGRTTREFVKEGLADNAASIKVVETGKAQTVIINTIAGRQVLSTGVPVFDQNGKIHRIYCNLRDITELNSLKEKYEQSEKLISKYLIELQEVKKLKIRQSVFISRSNKMKQILEIAYRIAHFDSNVLILGESGVGKDLIARIIHEASPRKETGTFVKINCGAIPAELLESELFGYVAGAFTGARREGKAGYLEIADKGTMFLDEVGDLPLNLQVKLLSAIQDQEVVRVGDTRVKKVDTRIIAATNRDLETMVKKGDFRDDLYYRLSVVPIYIPPLRERKEEIPFLLTHFLEKYNKKHGLHGQLSKEVIDILCEYKWPGNVRELSNLVEHLVVVTNEPLIKPEHLPPKYLYFNEKNHEHFSSGKSLKEEKRKFELKLIRAALFQSKTHEEAAHKLGISLSTLTRRIRDAKIDIQ
jgi:PAS domain S-box-containing protein